MANSKKKKSINIDKELYERFDYLYPCVIKDFLERSITLALQDKELFTNIFFNQQFLEVK